MLLVYSDILDRVENYGKYKEVYSEEGPKPLIENFIKENLQAVSYDVTITNKIMKFKDAFRKIKLSDEHDIKSIFEEVDISLGYDMRPGEYVLVQLNEYLNMPDDLAAHIRPRSTFTKIGLTLTCQHVNPSYKGQLQLGLLNSTPYVVNLTPELIIGQLLFEGLSGKIEAENLYRNKDNAKYQGEKGFVQSKVYKELDKKFNEYINSLI